MLPLSSKLIQIISMLIIKHLLIVFLASNIQAILLSTKQTLNIEVEMDNRYSWNIPTLFNNYQFSSLTSLKKIDTDSPSNICRVAVKEEGVLTIKSSQIYAKEEV